MWNDSDSGTHKCIPQRESLKAEEMELPWTPKGQIRNDRGTSGHGFRFMSFCDKRISVFCRRG